MHLRGLLVMNCPKAVQQAHTPLYRGGFRRNGASDGIRTRDPDLGKVVLYQLSYARKYPCHVGVDGCPMGIEPFLPGDKTRQLHLEGCPCLAPLEAQ